MKCYSSDFSFASLSLAPDVRVTGHFQPWGFLHIDMSLLEITSSISSHFQILFLLPHSAEMPLPETISQMIIF